MSISVREFIAVKDNVVGGSVTSQSMAGLVLTNNKNIPSNTPVLKFTKLEDVAKFFGYDSDEYKYAKYYFKGFKTALKLVDFLCFGLFDKLALPAWLGGGSVVATISKFAELASTKITFNINGKQTEVTVDLSKVVSYSDVALAVQTALTKTIPCLVTYNALLKAFRVQTIATGSDHTVDFCDDKDATLANLMMLRKQDGAVLSNGRDITTSAQNLDIITDYYDNFVSFTELVQFDVKTQLELAEWVNNKEVAEFCYVLRSQEINLTIKGNKNNIKATIDEVGYSNIAVVYGDTSHAMFTMAIGDCTDYKVTKGVLTWAFKAQDGLIPNVTTNQVAQALTEKKVNFYGAYSEKSAEYRFYQQGWITGKYNFLDNFYNEVWLINQVVVSIASLMERLLKLDFGLEGETLLRTNIQSVMKDAVKAGVAVKNIKIDELQALEIASIVGYDISSTLFEQGYFINIEDYTVSDKIQRKYPKVLIIYVEGESGHLFFVDTTAIL